MVRRNPRHVWTDAEIDDLVRRRLDGTTSAELAKEYGVTPDALMCAIRRHRGTSRLKVLDIKPERRRNRFFQARIARKWTMEHAAEVIGVAETTLYGWENGTISPRGYNAYASAKAYGVKLDWLLGYEEE